MAHKTIETTTKTIEHPLEDFFDIESNTTEVVVQTHHTELVKSPMYDEKDAEIEDNFQEVHDRAMEGHDALKEQLEDIDPKYVARVSEVAIQYLNTALSAASEKAKMKINKDKLKPVDSTNDGNLNITLDTNELVKILKQKAKEKIIDGESTIINTDEK